jgi:hypothetical protein
MMAGYPLSFGCGGSGALGTLLPPLTLHVAVPCGFVMPRARSKTHSARPKTVAFWASICC